jgi:multidrug efflux pump subunit AcrA (membrane-fusion protein)
MKFLYLDKKDRILAWFTPKNTALTAGIAAVLMAIPVWHESVSGRFMLEPSRSASVRAKVPGSITSLYVIEGQGVKVGQKLAQLRNVSLQSEYEDLRARLMLAAEHSHEASLHYAGYGPAEAERKQLATQVNDLTERNAALELTSPIAGIVLTPKVDEMLGTYVNAGTEVVEVGDIASLRARIYVSEYDLNKIRLGAPAWIEVQGQVGKWRTTSASIAPKPVEMDSHLGVGAELKGEANLPHYYQVDLEVDNSELKLRPGMMGMARVYGGRRSLAGMAVEVAGDFWGRKVW